MSTLESILSGEREAAPVSEATTTQATPETQQEQPQGQPDAPSNDETSADDRGMVPVAALQAERQKAKRYTEQVAEFQQKLEQQNAQWEARFSQMMGAMQPRPQAEAAPAPDIWDDPNAFVENRAAEIVSPLRQQMLSMAREVAEVRYQPDVVKAAEDAFNRAAATGQMDPEIHRRITRSQPPSSGISTSPPGARSVPIQRHTKPSWKRKSARRCWQRFNRGVHRQARAPRP